MRRPVAFEEAGAAVAGPVTKLCGRPTWLDGPQWPVSRALGRPMFFLGQFRLDDGPDGEPRLAYLFMTDSETLQIRDDDSGYDENRPGMPDVHETFEPEAGENAVIVQPGGRVPSFVTVRAMDEPRMCWRDEDHLPVDASPAPGRVPMQFLGGEPVWLQFDQTPAPGWRLVAQLTEQLGFNFGDDGVGYVFVSPDGTEGRFLWQCH
ncbi:MULTISPECIES: YwqG family protein [Catenuloplanes]|uniref:DUF1963 domain-containing protein n=1 Tax=Catenuloplanes niger TaxID=587534 RepID=A0AAE3ZY78_9ACTN|nr:DUF1963 domain-containing protein [Catenuloplanes niger]MDR7327399.1 hypothetical protein [Catenuloplanes niger]